MKLQKLFECCIRQGIAQDPRGAACIAEILAANKAAYDDLKAEEREEFDRESLSNPYADSRILNGTGEENIQAVLAGIDMETPELLLAQAVRASGTTIDLVLTHHPEGMAYATFYQVMGMQADIMNKFGVPITAAEAMTNSRMKEVGRKVKPQNHFRAVDAARLLGLPFMSMHTVADNHVATFLQRLFDDRHPRTLNDVMRLLKEQPEYRTAAATNTGPCILSGGRDDRAGRVYVDMTGGTEGAKEAIGKLAAAGVGTIVGMHLSEDHFKEAEKHHVRVVIAGHMASDNLGMNLLLDAVEKECGALAVIPCSGFRRFTRAAS